MTLNLLSQRRQLLSKLLNYSESLEILKSELTMFSWDCDTAITVCNPGHLISLLTRYQHHELSDEELEEWANLVECREDIDFQADCEELLSEIIFALANPGLEGPLAESQCQTWLKRLSEV